MMARDGRCHIRNGGDKRKNLLSANRGREKYKAVSAVRERMTLFLICKIAKSLSLAAGFLLLITRCKVIFPHQIPLRL